MRNLNLSQRVKLAFIVSFIGITMICMLILFASSKMTEDYIFSAQLNRQAAQLDFSNSKSLSQLPREYNLYLNKQSIPANLRDYVIQSEPGTYELEHPNDLDYHYAIIQYDQGIAYLFYNVHALELDEHLEQQLLHTLLIGFAVLLLAILLFMQVILKRSLAPMHQLINAISEQTSTPDKPIQLTQPADNEIGLLSSTIFLYSKRIAEFIEREREFSCFASHELRTPVMINKGAIELLKLQVKPADPLYKPIARIERATNNMEEVIETLLSLSREQTQTNTEDIMANHAIEHVVALWHEKAKANRQTIKVTTLSRTTTKYPKAQLEMVLSNLVKNAIQHGCNAAINITADSQIIEVKNSKKSLHNGNLPSHDNMGLGLIIVKRICQQQGWQFNCQSNDSHFSATITLV
ncbi:two-component sensor histidine kinase [Pseudoalteromonas sp. A25]|nr:two-component sensor histidine kinase [Pseudoalteromonas sp. A25]